MSQLIEKYPNNPMLLANRGIFLSQMNEDDQALIDIGKSLELQPLNYIAYFNLFSIYMKDSQEDKAIQNLYCALSVMDLLRGEYKKNVNDLSKAIELAHNNIEARVLKGLLLL